jgi:acetyl esterase/lipase
LRQSRTIFEEGNAERLPRGGKPVSVGSVMKAPLRFLAPLLALSLLAPRAALTAPSEPIRLWPGDAPGEKGDIGKEGDMTKPSDGKPGAKGVIRIGNVSVPTITLYRPPAEKDTGTAVVVCPGGGYSILAWDLEGTEVCDWLNSIGVTGVLLKYRVPARKGAERYAAPLQDAQRALGLVREHATEWKLDPKRIGILGFSAGGHLSAAASNNYAERTYPRVDAADDQSCRPDFAILIYPAYLAVKEKGDALAPELVVTAKTPPTFLAQTQDDPVRVQNSLYYYIALTQAKVPAEMHLYPSGGHGYGLRPTEKMVTTWPERAAEWMNSQGLIPRKN